MEKLPSRKAITEMMSWVSDVGHRAAHESPQRSLRSATQVKTLLQKLKVRS
jgi:nesprin-2